MIARLLLKGSIDVNAQDKDRNTALHLAAFQARFRITRVLLDHGANTNARDEDGETPLHLLSQGKYHSQDSVFIAWLQLERGIDVDAQDKEHKTTLHLAAFQARLGITRVLLDHGANTSAKNKNGETLLHRMSWNEYYSQEDSVSTAWLLLECSMDIHAIDEGNNSDDVLSDGSQSCFSDTQRVKIK